MGSISCTTVEFGEGVGYKGVGWCIVMTLGAGKGGNDCDKESRSCAASVSSMLRTLNIGISPSLLDTTSLVC